MQVVVRAIVGGMLDVAKYVSNVSKSYSTTTKGPYHVASWGTSPLQEGCQLTPFSIND